MATTSLNVTVPKKTGTPQSQRGALNKGSSIVDFLKSKGESSSFGSRRNLAVQQGIVKNANEYTGSASQNVSLLRSLQSAGKQNTTVAPSATGISSLEQADSFINKDNVKGKEEANVRTSFKKSQNFFKNINDLVSKDLGDAPDAPNFTDLFKTQRDKFGLDTIEQNISEYTAEKRNIEARLRQRTNAEKGKAVPLNVISGRVDETTRQERENLDFVEREIAYNTDRATSAYSAIDTIIGLTEKDFNAANKVYTEEFDRRKSMYSIASGIEQTEYNRERDAKEDARANGEIIVNTAIMAGKPFGDLEPETQLSLQKMGVQSGLGQSFFEDMLSAGAIAKGEEILTTVTAEDKNSVTVVYKDGTTDVITTRGGAKPKTTKLTSEEKKAAASEEFDLAIQYAKDYSGSDEELKRDLLKDSDLTPTDINSIIDTRNRLIPDEKLNKDAISIVEDNFDKAIFRARDSSVFGRASELDKAKEAALSLLDKNTRIIDGTEVTDENESRLRKQIQSLKIEDLNI